MNRIWFWYTLASVHILCVICCTHLRAHLSTSFKIFRLRWPTIVRWPWFDVKWLFVHASSFLKEPTFAWQQDYNYSYDYDLQFCSNTMTCISPFKNKNWLMFIYKPRGTSLLNAIKWSINLSFLAGHKQWWLFIRVLYCKHEAATCKRSSKLNKSYTNMLRLLLEW